MDECKPLVGGLYALGAPGVQEDLPLGKRYLELSATQGMHIAVEFLKAAVTAAGSPTKTEAVAAAITMARAVTELEQAVAAEATTKADMG